jgi:DNA-binding MarR family transcriptional regulator
MDTATFKDLSGDGEDAQKVAEDSTCDALARIIDDERLLLMGLVMRSHRHLVSLLGHELEQAVGIPLVWFDVLIKIGGAPEGRLTMSKLSTDIALTTGGVTRLVDRMVEAGLVARQNCPSDRRSVHVVLTAEGQAMLHRALAAQLEGIDRHLWAPLDQADRAALGVALSKLLSTRC